MVKVGKQHPQGNVRILSSANKVSKTATFRLVIKLRRVSCSELGRCVSNMNEHEQGKYHLANSEAPI